MRTWLPEGMSHGLHIEHRPLEDAGPFTGGGWKLVPHTTESPRESVDAMYEVLRAKRAAPHFVIGWRKGVRYPVVIQMVAMDRAGRSLEHPTGTPETNRANAIQIEICGYTRECHDWDENWLRALANLWRMIAINTPVTLKVTRSFQRPVRYTATGWVRAAAIAGHCHAPNQTHSDPTGLRARHIAHMANDKYQIVHPR